MRLPAAILCVLCVFSGFSRAANKPNFILILDTAPNTPSQLYNLDTDPGETKNLYAERQGIVKELKSLLD